MKKRSKLIKIESTETYLLMTSQKHNTCDFFECCTIPLSVRESLIPLSLQNIGTTVNLTFVVPQLKLHRAIIRKNVLLGKQ